MTQYELDLLELSKQIGGEVHGLIDKLDRAGPLFDAILRMECATPKEATMLLAMYVVVFSTTSTREQSIRPFIAILPEVEQLLMYLTLEREREGNEDR